MTAAAPALTIADEIAHDVQLGDMTPVEALAELRSRGLTPDREALAEAVHALDLRERFLGEQGNPYDYVGVDGPRTDRGSIWQAAVDKTETEYSFALQVLARRIVQAVAS